RHESHITAVFPAHLQRDDDYARVLATRHFDSRGNGAYKAHTNSCWIRGQPMRVHDTVIHAALAAMLVASGAFTSSAAVAQVIDPGVRQASTDNGPPPPLAGLTPDELAFFQDGLARFSAVKLVRSPTGDNSGLGPRFNSNACVSCHLQPFVGGSSPSANPLPAVAQADGATN